MKKIVYLLTFIVFVVSCNSSDKKTFDKKWTQEKAPEYFKARFETTQGNFDIEAKRKWSPNGVDRLYQLINHHFYTDIALFRVLPNWVTQFGIHNDSLVNKQWESVVIKDEPVLKSNDSMTIAFARDGIDSRTTQIYINMKNNNKLDTINYIDVVGFPVIARVINGMETVHKFYSGYDGKAADEQDSIYAQGNSYLKKKYPKLDYIKKAYILK